MCVDTEADFTSSAKRFDLDLAKAVAKKGEKTDGEDAEDEGKGNPVKSDNPPRHVTFRLEADMDIGQLESRDGWESEAWHAQIQHELAAENFERRGTQFRHLYMVVHHLDTLVGLTKIVEFPG